MYPSSARIAARRGKALKLVLTARKRISAVATWKTHEERRPVAEDRRADDGRSTVGPPSDGRAEADRRRRANVIADEEDAEQDRHRRHRVRGVLRLRRLERRAPRWRSPPRRSGPPSRPRRPAGGGRSPSVSVPGGGTCGGIGGDGRLAGRRSGRPRGRSSAAPARRRGRSGTAKMLPDSRRPRRLAIVMRAIAASRDLDRGSRRGPAGPSRPGRPPRRWRPRPSSRSR